MNPEHRYLSRRKFLKGVGALAAGTLFLGGYNWLNSSPAPESAGYSGSAKTSTNTDTAGDNLTSEEPLSASLENPPPRYNATPLTILVIGAGIAGLSSASALNRLGYQVTVLEGRNRIGGRTWTDRSMGNIPLELGAAWIHGISGNPLFTLAQGQGVETKVTDYASTVLYDSEGKLVSKYQADAMQGRFYKILMEAIKEKCGSRENMISLQTAISYDKDFNSLSGNDLLEFNYELNTVVEHNYSGSALSLSACQLIGSPAHFGGDDVILPEGYGRLIERIAQGLDIRLGQVVESIDYSKDQTEVRTNQGSFFADKVIVTLPLGVLKRGKVKFTPELPDEKQAAIEKLGMGVSNRLYLRFSDVFWDRDVDWIGYIPQDYGQWAEWQNIGKYLNQPVLVGWNVADYGEKIESLSDNEIVSCGMEVLRRIYGSIPEPNSALVTRWASDPFTYGAYSFIATGATVEDRDILAKPVAAKLYFAGEATARYGVTTTGAYISGRREARRIDSRVNMT